MTKHCRWSIAAAQLILLSGCAFRPQVSRMAVEYNEFVAQATNRQTLINILRARDREPLHFTNISAVRGSANLTGTAGLSVALPGISKGQVPAAAPAEGFATNARTVGADTWTPNVGITVETGTSFDIGIDASDSFWKGVLKPVSAETIAYYLSQGWSPELLSALFIEDITYSAVVTDQHGNRHMFENVLRVRNDLAPTTAEDQARFLSAVRCRPMSYTVSTSPKIRIPIASLTELDGVSKETLASVRMPAQAKPTPTPSSKESTVTPPEQEMKTTYLQLGDDQPTAGLSLARANDCYGYDGMLGPALRRAIDAPYLKPVGGVVPLPDVSKTSAAAGSKIIRVIASGQSQTGRDADIPRLGEVGSCNVLMVDGFTCDIVTTLTLRSPEGVIYYLGETLRPDAIDSRLLDRQMKERLYPIITVVQDGDVKLRSTSFVPAITVNYHGTRYYMPSSGPSLNSVAGRSSEVVTLVQQLLNLQRSGKDLPLTQSVRIVN